MWQHEVTKLHNHICFASEIYDMLKRKKSLHQHWLIYNQSNLKMRKVMPVGKCVDNEVHSQTNLWIINSSHELIKEIVFPV